MTEPNELYVVKGPGDVLIARTASVSLYMCWEGAFELLYGKMPDPGDIDMGDLRAQVRALGYDVVLAKLIEVPFE